MAKKLSVDVTGEYGSRQKRVCRGAFDLTELPVDCIENVISLTSPKGACQLSLMATWLRSVADSDQVWEKFLPADYQEILGRSTEGEELLMLLSSMSKKQFFRLLCVPLLIDGQTKSFWTDKSTGKKCFLLGAKALKISLIKPPRRRKFITLKKSRFGTALRLFGANYVHFTAEIKPSMLSPDTRYGAYLVFDNVAGDELLDKRVSVLVAERGSEQYWYGSVSSFTRTCQRREDGWLEVELGEVLVTGEEDNDQVIRVEEEKFCHSEESDLIYEGIEIRVKH